MLSHSLRVVFDENCVGILTASLHSLQATDIVTNIAEVQLHRAAAPPPYCTDYAYGHAYTSCHTERGPHGTRRTSRGEGTVGTALPDGARPQRENQE